MQAIQETIDQLVAQVRREMDIVSQTHGVVLSAFDTFFQVGGCTSRDRAHRDGMPPH